MPKIDFKKKLKGVYSDISSKEFSILDVPPLNFLMIDGQGYPGTSQEFKIYDEEEKQGLRGNASRGFMVG
jgi:hypothetical protein